MQKVQVTTWIAGALLAALLTGCGKDENSAPSASTPHDQTPVPNPTEPIAPAPTAPAPTVPAPTVPAPPRALNTTTQAATTLPGDRIAQAQGLLDQITGYLKEHKFELAQKAFDQLDSMKGSLPAEWAARIETARTALNAAKLTNSIPTSLPGGIKIGG